MTKNLERKHILIVGKNSDERHKFLNELVKGANKKVYRFPPNLQTFDEYIEQVRELFPFVPTTWKEQNPKKWTRNQVWDFHLDWTENIHGVLIIIEEFGKMEESWRLEIIRDYLTTSYDQESQNEHRGNYQLIISQEDDDDLVEKLVAVFGLKDNEKRTERQIISGRLKVIDLNVT